MIRKNALVGFLCMLCSMQLYAEELLVHVFINDKPFSDVAIEVNGEVKAVTDNNGMASVSLPEGAHRVVLATAERSARFKFSLAAGEQATAQVAWRYDAEPEINVEIISGAKASDLAKGLLKGYVLVRDTEQPIAGAEVYVESLDLIFVSDQTGYFEAELPHGSYGILVKHDNYASKLVEDVFISARVAQETIFRLGKKLNLELASLPPPEAMEELHVVGQYIDNSATAQERDAHGVLDALGYDEFSITGDSNAVFALQRVTGVTIVDGKFVYVRGLGERYSSTLFNNANLPSPDLSRRVVPLDLFPAGVLEELSINKTYSPDLPADYSGGVVNLVTRRVPDTAIRKFALSLGSDSRTLGEKGLTYDGGDTDILGIDDDTRSIPGYLDALSGPGRDPLSRLSPEVREEAGEALVNNYTVQSQTMAPDLGMDVIFGNRYDTDNGNAWGYLFSMKYKNGWSYHHEDRRTFIFDQNVGYSTQDDTQLTISKNGVDLAGMFNLTYEIGQNHILKSSTLITRRTDNTVVRMTGFLAENELDVRDTTLEWIERELTTQQFDGEHILSGWKNSILQWHTSFSSASHYEPDTRFFRYELQSDGRYAFSTRGNSNERSYKDLQDDSYDIGIDLSVPVALSDSVESTIKFGLSKINKERDFRFYKFRFRTDTSTHTIPREVFFSPSPEDILTPEYIGQNGYMLDNNNLASDNYRAEHSVDAHYLMSDTDFNGRYRLMLGFRVEDSNPVVESYELVNPDNIIEGGVREKETLPALSATWFVSDAVQLRVAASQTLNRPDIRELSPSPYIDPVRRETIVGNPNLISAQIDNYDVRWEWYLNELDKLQVALFYKEFLNPIEQVTRPGAGGVKTYKNTPSAENMGIEFQLRNSLSFIKENWSDFFLKTNFAVIDSEVRIDLENSGVIDTNARRELQGQSPWVVNLQLGYDNLATETQFSVALNVAGKRIDEVGVDGLPDIYEQSAPRLDLAYARKVGDAWKLKLQAKNILDPEIEFKQADQVKRRYKQGVNFYIGMDYNF